MNALEQKQKARSQQNALRHLGRVILKLPRITEKASLLSDRDNAYTFEIEDTATKSDVKMAIKATYNVTPRMVRITRLPGKVFLIWGRKVRKPGVKKAVVYLPKGEKIEFI